MESLGRRIERKRVEEMTDHDRRKFGCCFFTLMISAAALVTMLVYCPRTAIVIYGGGLIATLVVFVVNDRRGRKG